MRFVKMHGLGNKYIFFNLLEERLGETDLPAMARAVSDVNFGIGSDGMILVCPSERADFRMRIFNADGSEGKTCGNGLRCTAKFLYDHGYVRQPAFTIETWGGIVGVEIGEGNERLRTVKVDMGLPRLRKKDVPMAGDPDSTAINELFEIGGERFHLTCVSVGNPHAILFVGDVYQFPLEKWGPVIEHAPLFPERVNFGIVQVLNGRELLYRVWERGSGITMACGSGACAAVVAATLNGKVQHGEPVIVHLPGGDLEIQWDASGRLWKTGPAETVCYGEWSLKPNIA